MHTLDILIAKYFIIIPVVTAIIIWFRLPADAKKQFAVYAVLGAIASLLLAKLGSHLHDDPRPFVVGHFKPYFGHGADNGFPSDHTLFSSFLAFVVWRYNRQAGYWLLAVAVLIGLSRVIAGVHHLQDIIGSIVFAALGTWGAWWLTNRFLPTRRNTGRRRPIQPTVTPGSHDGK